MVSCGFAVVKGSERSMTGDRPKRMKSAFTPGHSKAIRTWKPPEPCEVSDHAETVV